ncbi:hypothetical protein RB653_007683 [Dictyostelium firmibasis]|uniref:Ubiquitin-like domain-containing protein n=1 Tax=Dictyostelium firmibasis TaxID=79012 RepID=A0AAN7TP38_9MYCE
MEENDFKINGVPITSLKAKQIETEIRKRGGKIPTNSVKDTCVTQLREILKEEQKQTSSTKKRTSNGELPNINKKVVLGDPKALQLEKKILNGFNFYPIVERLKFDELGFRLVKEYTRFIVIKILTQDIESVKTLPPPLIGRIWISHILDTNRYEELCNLIELKIHHNPDGFEEVPQQVKRERYVKTLELYEQYFTKSSMDTDIWENEYLLYDEEENDDDDDEELQEQQQGDEEEQQLQLQKEKDKEKEKEKEKVIDKEKEKEKENEKEKEKENEKEKETNINDKKQKDNEKEIEKEKETSNKTNSINDIENNTYNDDNNSNTNNIDINNNGKQISKEEPTTPQKITNPPKVKNSPITNSPTTIQTNLNGESTSTTASVASDNSPNRQPTPNTPNTPSSSSKHQKPLQTPNTPSSSIGGSSQLQQTPPSSSSKLVRGGEHKISIGFVSLKTQKKEITTFHGVGLTKSLFKVIKAYSKLKSVEISSVKFLFNGKPIMNETPTDLRMKDGDTITVVQGPPTPSSSSSSTTTSII